ncbi:hypothetical protein [Brevundimonas sp. A19_0]|uniref:hypothetical protein n=1 Tax=Brevundimonas sp. A19_0 TaxID=2821087 RepID=UPI001ADD4765|nr:hypothetical protein [Brevundimonas sp. A19_0]MBO9502032.1 hypothetical protein [Brevundimonas sp. A19_0]
MTGGLALTGGADAPKRRGRPKGSRNRRAADLAAYVEVKTGGTAALHLAKSCLPTVADVRRAGSPIEAEMALARRRVEAAQAEAERLDGGLRQLVRDQLADLVEGLERGTVDNLGKRLEALLDGWAVHAGKMTLAQAFAAVKAEQVALLPYTDQKQPQKVEVKDDRPLPVLMLVGGSGGPAAAAPESVENQGASFALIEQVAQDRSHDGGEGQ